MKIVILAALGLLAAVQANPLSQNTITYEDNNGNIVTEDLDQPEISTYAVDINKLKFVLYTQSNKVDGQMLKAGDVNVLAQSNFKSSRPTKFLIHGWQNNYQMEAVQSLKDAYLASSNVNVIACDYEPYGKEYLSAVSNADQVAQNIAKFISFLVAQGAKGSDMHILGHSLGAHIAGGTARALKSTTQVARITGLDPAGPLFENKAEGKRLSKSDAPIVEAVHTSTEFGIKKAVGTHDFYPNGGSDQPTCAHAAMSGGCDHSASFRYWAQSVGAPNTFPVYACQSEADAQKVTTATTTCKKISGYMGEISATTTPAGVYFVAV